MIRDTSIAAFRTIESNGLLSMRRWSVYSCLYHNGPATAGEVGQLISYNRNLTASRLIELRELGVVKECGERYCRVTGFNVILWDVTSNLPAGRSAHPKKKTRKELLREVEHLRSLLIRAYDKIKELKP